MKKIIIAGLVLIAGLIAQTAFAQTGALNNWAPVGGPATLAVTTTTANVAFPSIGPTGLVCNKGSADVFLALGADDTVEATASDYWLKSGKCQPFNLKPFGVQFTHVAAITGASTATLYIESGYGTPWAPQ